MIVGYWNGYFGEDNKSGRVMTTDEAMAMAKREEEMERKFKEIDLTKYSHPL